MFYQPRPPIRCQLPAASTQPPDTAAVQLVTDIVEFPIELGLFPTQPGGGVPRARNRADAGSFPPQQRFGQRQNELFLGERQRYRSDRRIATFRENPPGPSWNGAWVFAEK